MKMKIVINVPLRKEKAKSKAMKIAVAEEGVTSVSIGKENDQLEVVGVGVDSVCLVKSLRKKFCFADILSIAEVKPAAAAAASPSPSPDKCPLPLCMFPPPPFQPLYECHYYDPENPSCYIM
ncbi:heavy metal-associated isoprenylated plant protein 47-like [Salvia splendens]|uniref:heavy metal-associated isoprenylated plant protein 47-like n=1 Tax=Salvia splendens TaxID=180675 RepID=UPI001C261185|nr:heavy metal-associated isoprenylated plant protein 47-like [Salvia splendens]